MACMLNFTSHTIGTFTRDDDDDCDNGVVVDSHGEHGSIKKNNKNHDSNIIFHHQINYIYL